MLPHAAEMRSTPDAPAEARKRLTTMAPQDIEAWNARELEVGINIGLW